MPQRRESIDHVIVLYVLDDVVFGLRASGAEVDTESLCSKDEAGLSVSIFMIDFSTCDDAVGRCDFAIRGSCHGLPLKGSKGRGWC